ncbi:MAG: FeoA family protein [Candidatus Hecatellaceae archaeon]
MSLAEALPGGKFRIVDFTGGVEMRLRLMHRGLNIGDIVRVLGSGPMRGPVYVENLATGVRLALGRGVASRILVEPVR